MTSPRDARRVIVEGIVQGVGFRPFVYTLAARHALAGWVRNTAQGVEMEVEGEAPAVQAFLDALDERRPPLAHLDRVLAERVAPRGHRGFAIRASRDGDGVQPIAPDVALCDACLREVMDPGDRRCAYPFTNCTHCGPRFTITRAIPYDRPNTTMAAFAMCAACRAEYDDPANRRFHAQPNACPSCGPRLVLVDPRGRALPGDPLRETRRLLAGGRIVAIKGIGGFHLACDAADGYAVRHLRERKGREAKPLALMVPDLPAAERLAEVSGEERGLLASPARPIVLLRARPGAAIAPSVAPGLGWLGVMLPYSPLHHLLFVDPRAREAGAPPEPRPLHALVMTSGNRSEEPIAVDDADALARLAAIADAFLLHDRPIHVRCDDSVARVAGGAVVPIRRSRGLAPFPLRLPFEARPILACGADLKAALCLTRGPYAFMSPHVGDLENDETYASFEQMAERMASLFRVRPEAVAHDLHPGYLSTRYALARDPALPRIAVQHHHAHVAACLAEHGLAGRLIGVAFDGTGYGTDGRIWGGEFLVAGYADFARAAHLAYVPMPGGERAVREPFRMALAHLHQAGIAWDPDLAPVRVASDAERRIIAQQIARDVNAPLTSSMGRLIDAVASLLDVRQRASYEAQAAMELEALAAPAADAVYPVTIRGEHPAVIEPAPLLRAIVGDLTAGAPVALIAARFHATLVGVVAETCARIRRSTGLDRVALSGGVFQNATLLEGAHRALASRGFEVFSPRRVPPNDGGIALGQAAVAHARLELGAGEGASRAWRRPANRQS
jgi:hydrogenase maturation protein HypF